MARKRSNRDDDLAKLNQTQVKLQLVLVNRLHIIVNCILPCGTDRSLIQNSPDAKNRQLET